jgi:hypothetical protein
VFAGIARLSVGSLLMLGLFGPGAAIAHKAPCPPAPKAATPPVQAGPSVRSEPAQQERASPAKAKEKKQRDHDPLHYHDYIDDL